MGNRLAATRTLTSTQTHSYTYDDANQLVTADGVPYTWDAAGNLLADGVYTYAYDPAQRLVSVTGPGLAWSAGYTADGIRTWQATGGVTTTYRLDLQPELATVLQASSPAGTTSYLYGLEDSPLASETDGVWRYLSGRDALNSVRQETDAAGAVLAVRRYDPYGVPLVGDGGQPYGYTGEWWDAGTELVYLRARYLRPALGLFLTKDPWPGDVRRPGTLQGYGYAGSNPLRWIDPSGRDVECPGQDAGTCGGGPGGAGQPHLPIPAVPPLAIVPLEANPDYSAWLSAGGCTQCHTVVTFGHIPTNEEMVRYFRTCQRNTKIMVDGAAYSYIGTITGYNLVLWAQSLYAYYTTPAPRISSNAIGNWGVQKVGEQLPVETGSIYQKNAMTGQIRFFDGVFLGRSGQYVEIKTTTRDVVSLSSRIRHEITFDASLAQRPLWIFVNGRPSAGLIEALNRARILWVQVNIPK